MRNTLLMIALLSCLVAPYVGGFVIPLNTPPKTRTDNQGWLTNVENKKDCRRFGTNDSEDMNVASLERRNLLLSFELSLATSASTIMMFPQRASADLVQFPCKEGTLKNTYHFMRAGESKLESQNIWGTNPMFLTNRVDNALSEAGISQVEEACLVLEQAQLDLSIVKFPLAANAMDTADMVASNLLIGRNRMVPEYTYMDQRGIGKWDMQPLQSTQDAIWAMDEREAGEYGLAGGLPPPNDDGTANEMLGHQVIRLRQLLSLLETFGSGDSILLVFPDGTGPALLSCLIAGIPLNRVHELDFCPGEVRLDVSPKSVSALLSTGPSSEYLQAIQRGGKQLQVLRKNPQELVNIKDQAYAKELRLEKEQETARKEAELKREQAAQDERARQHKNALDQKAKKNINNKAPENEDETDQIGMIAMTGGLLTLSSLLGETSVANTTEVTQKQVIDQQEKNLNSSISTNESRTEEEIPTHKEVKAMEDLVKSAPILVPEFSEKSASSPHIINPASVPSNVPSEQARLHTSSNESRTEEEIPTYKEIKAMEDLVEIAPISVPEFSEKSASSPHITNPASVPSNVPSEKDRLQAAERSMEEYLNQDDGGDSFIGFMDELMNEDA